jgi:Lrp/AsnC family transcriptional regulator, leucine-responsive regulatory protein
MASAFDVTDAAILNELQTDARLSYRQLASRVHLSPPATADRVRRLEHEGVLQGYRAVVNPAAVGRGLEAFIRVRVRDAPDTEALATQLGSLTELREAHHLVGEDCFLLRVAVSDIGQLEDVLARLGRYGTTNTSIVLSSLVSFAPLTPSDPYSEKTGLNSRVATA